MYVKNPSFLYYAVYTIKNATHKHCSRKQAVRYFVSRSEVHRCGEKVFVKCLVANLGAHWNNLRRFVPLRDRDDAPSQWALYM